MGKPKIRKGDRVVVITGKYAGKRGKVLRVEPAKNRVVVDGVNVAKKHQKPTQKVIQGGIITQEAPFHLSNVMLVCSSCGEPTRVGRTRLDDGKSARVCKRCGEMLEKK